MKRTNKMKKLITLFTVVFCLSMLLSVNAFASSYTSGSVGGYTCFGSLSMGSSSASGSTGYYGPTEYLSVTVYYTYKFGQNTYTDNASNGNPSSSVGVTVTSRYAGSVSNNASGIHSLSGGGYNWNGNTSIP